MERHACISLRQPYATLIACGEKTYETRSRDTKYRGEIYIHAAKGIEQWQREGFEILDEEIAIRELLGYDSIEEMPRGVIVARAVLSNTFPAERARLRRPEQSLFCNFADTRFAYQLDDVELVESDVTVSGQLGIFYLADEAVTAAVA